MITKNIYCSYRIVLGEIRFPCGIDDYIINFNKDGIPKDVSHGNDLNNSDFDV